MLDKSAIALRPGLLELFVSLLPEMRQISQLHRDPAQPKNLIKLTPSPTPKSLLESGVHAY